MEVFFLDVAQGTCQVIMLGQRRAIVIDCGIRNDRIVLQFLRRMGVEHIERLIVSHCHGDHIGGAVSVLGAFQNPISRGCQSSQRATSRRSGMELPRTPNTEIGVGNGE